MGDSNNDVRAPFRADHVGSFLRPAELRSAMERAASGGIDDAELKALQDKAIRDVVAMQESVGLGVATDGEFRHASFHHFLEKVDGVAAGRPDAHAGVAKKPFEPRSYAVVGKLRHSRPIEVDAFQFLKGITRQTPKVTMVSPTMLLRAGRKDVNAEIYSDLGQFYADIPAVFQAEIAQLGAAGCKYIQLDDTNYAYLCDPEFRSRRQLGGADFQELSMRYAGLINASIAGRPAGMRVGIHICRGNSGGSFAAQGGYEPVADTLLNALDVDGYFLEYDDERSGGFEPLRFFPKNSHKRIVLGIVSTKRPELEAKDDLKRRIDAAAKFVPLENLCISPQCGFASTYKGNPVSEDIQRRKLELVVETAREVWGSAR